MKPPESLAHLPQRGLPDAERIEDRRRRPPAELRDLIAGLVHLQPDALEHEPGQGDQEQGSEEDPVAHLVDVAVELRIVGLAVRAGVVELLRPHVGAAEHHVEQTRHQGGSEDVQQRLHDQVKLAVVDPDAEERTEHVVVEPHDDGANRQRHPSVKDPAVCETHGSIPPPDRRVRVENS